MAVEEVPILLCDDPTGGNLIPGLPTGSTNIFQRIIRNPRPDSPYARERECTEMLASVLISAPMLRERIFRWMADLSGLDPNVIDSLDFDIATEQSIGTKRDDLRIVGRNVSEEDTSPQLLWTIEVKVGSFFHHSVAQRLDDEEEESSDETVDPEIELELVNQLKHYDDWLDKQQSEHRGGFVLALSDMKPLLSPLNLKQKWTCFSWTKLGLAVKAMIEGESVPADQMLLAKHFLGFISTNLLRTTEMPASNLKVDFNDMALIRAFGKIGRECNQKINDLLSSVSPLIAEASIGVGEVVAHQKLFGSSGVSSIWRYLVPGWVKGEDPWIEISIGYEEPYGDYFGLRLLMSPKHPKADPVQKAMLSLMPKLTERNPRWKHTTGDAGDYTILELWEPLTNLLTAESQLEYITRFIKAALGDIEAAGAIVALNDAVGGKAKAIKTK